MRTYWLIALGSGLLGSGCLVYTDDLIDDSGTTTGGSPPVGGTGGVATGGSGGGVGGATPSGGTGGSGGGDGGTGGGGTGATGGTGTGGTMGSCVFPDDVEIDMIDDMSSPDNTILGNNARNGSWIGYHGSDIAPTPAPASGDTWPSEPMTERPDEAGNFALNYLTDVTGSEPGELWHQFGFSLTNAFDPYDLSGYDGVMYCAKKGVIDGDDDKFPTLQMAVVDDSTTNGKEFWHPATKTLTSDWSLVTLPFPRDAEGTDWSPVLNDIKIIKFRGKDGAHYDIWVDDIALYKDK